MPSLNSFPFFMNFLCVKMHVLCRAVPLQKSVLLPTVAGCKECKIISMNITGKRYAWIILPTLQEWHPYLSAVSLNCVPERTCLIISLIYVWALQPVCWSIPQSLSPRFVMIAVSITSLISTAYLRRRKVAYQKSLGRITERRKLSFDRIVLVLDK